MKPVTEKFDKEIEEISKLRDVTKQIIPYSEQVQRLALPGPSGEAPKMVADVNKKIHLRRIGIYAKQGIAITS